MHDDDIRSVAHGLASRDGLAGLTRLLGFASGTTAPLRPSWRVPVRSARSIARGTLRLHVLVTRGAIGTPELRILHRDADEIEPAAHHVLIASEPARRRVIIACDALRDGIRHVDIDPAAVRPVDIDVLRDLAARPDEHGTAAALRIYRALGRNSVSARFFRDMRGVRDAIASSWRGLPRSAAAERDALALILLSRLVFLYFLQRSNLLDGNPDFLPDTFARWRRRAARGSTFFRGVLTTLFFGVLNRRPENRTARARSLGNLPYLNGGLFERQRIERARPGLDLDDGVIALVLDSLLQKYRFTADAATADHSGIGGGIDPEMLGRMYEGLMPGDRRTATGSFYTPAATVDSLVIDVLAAYLGDGTPRGTELARRVLRGEESDAADRELRAIADAAARVRILDPACGSGAFLLGALARLENARAAAGRLAVPGSAPPAPDRYRADIVGRTLHGVDLLEDAALICSLRLWLSLVPRSAEPADVKPLPNLDRRIRQGDALVDPLDLAESLERGGTAIMQPLLRRLEPASRAYLTADPQTRPALRRKLASLERRLALSWLTRLQRHLDHGMREMRARTLDTDLFGAPAAHARAAHAHLRTLQLRRESLTTALQEMRRHRALPFFSFRVHFAETPRFDVILSNPPWVRAHRWPAALAALRTRFRVCTDAGWPFAATTCGGGSQVDLAFLFLERALGLLLPRGMLGMVLPAKLMRSLAPGGARALLLEQSEILSIEDHSLDQRAVFAADAFTAVVTARRRDMEADPHDAVKPDEVRIRMTRGATGELRFTLPSTDLPLRPGDPSSPWLIAPPEAAAAMRTMQRLGTIVRDSGLLVRRGAMTTANDAMVIRDIAPKLGDLAHVRTEGYYRRGSTDRRRHSALVEASAVRPVLRGTDIAPWHACVERHVIWSPACMRPGAAPPRRLAAYLRRHAAALGPGHATGALHRISSDIAGHKVVWSDLATDLRAAAVPASIRAVTGEQVSVIPLNTVYFIPVSCERHALLLAGYLNSMPIRTFARTIAERAKDAHFRFFAWVVSMLPLPPAWQAGAMANAVVEISRAAHAAGGIDADQQVRLDDTIARMFDLTRAQISALAAFDAWLAGREAAS